MGVGGEEKATVVGISDLTEKVTLDHRPGQGKGVGALRSGRTALQPQGTGDGKGTVACLKKRKGHKTMKGRGGRDEINEATRRRSAW